MYCGGITMKHFFTYSIITIQNFALFIFSILAIIFYNCFNLDFYKNFYEKENLAPSINTTSSELINNTENLLAYLKDNTSLNKNWFSDKDILHMIDVKNLYNVSFKVMTFCLIIFVITTIIIIITKKTKTLLYITKTFNKTLVIFILLIAILAGIIAYNFNSFWIRFHTILFSNDLWLLSPDESNLIKMVPEEFFINLITRIITHIFIVFTLLLITNIVVKRKITSK